MWIISRRKINQRVYPPRHTSPYRMEDSGRLAPYLLHSDSRDMGISTHYPVPQHNRDRTEETLTVRPSFLSSHSHLPQTLPPHHQGQRRSRKFPRSEANTVVDHMN